MQQRTRTIDLDRRAIDPDARTIKATLSTEQPVDRFGESEVLEHSTKAINFERASSGLPLLFAHDQRQPVGVAENIRLEGRELKATLRFSRSAKGDEVLRDVADGVLRHLSIGYRIDATENTPSGYRATRWTPMEASVVSVPADHHAQIGRSFITMDNERDDNMTRSQRRAAREAEIEHQAEAEREERAAVRAAKAERERIGLIRAAVNGLDIDDATVESWIENGRTIAECRGEIIEALKRRETPLNPRIDVPNTLAQRDRSSIWGSTRDTTDHQGARAAMIDGLLVRAGILKPKDAHRDAAQFASVSLLDLASQCLGRAGVSAGRTPDAILARMHTSSDFPYILANVANKSLQMGFENEPASHRVWVRTTEVLNFKTQSRVQRSEAPGLLAVAEGAEFTHGSFGERQEQYAISTYGRIFACTRQMLVNDDLQAFSTLPAAFGAAAARKEADAVYSVLTANAAMSDSVALFHTASHGNLAGTPTALSATSLGVARAAMRKQMGSGGLGYLNIIPRYLIVPAALETTAEILVASTVKVGGSNDEPNAEFVRSLSVVVDPRLDAASATAWYLAADPAQVDTVELGYLAGQRGVFVEEEHDFATDAWRFKARLDFGTKAIDWRGLYKNAGA